MTATWTPYARDQMQAAVLTNDIYVPPTSFWLVLSNIPITVNATNDLVDEPDPANGYSRLEVPLGSAFWTGTGFGEHMNNAPTPSALTITGDCGLVMGWALADDPTIGAGNFWVVGTLETSMQLNPTNSPYNADDLTLGIYD